MIGRTTGIIKIKLLVLIVLSTASLRMHGQGPEDPPRPISVSTIQNMSFGTFYHGAAGGSVVLDPATGRTGNGSVILLFPAVFSMAQFDITGNSGTIITLSFGGPVTLTGPGGSMTMTVGPSDPVSPFVLNVPYPVTTRVTIGATLNVGPPASNPPGAYNGTFNIIFNQN